MPTIVIEGYRFRFYSTDRLEPPHVHVIRGENVAKIWVSPVSVEYNYGYPSHELGRILELAVQHQDELLEAWYGYFGA